MKNMCPDGIFPFESKNISTCRIEAIEDVGGKNFLISPHAASSQAKGSSHPNLALSNNTLKCPAFVETTSSPEFTASIAPTSLKLTDGKPANIKEVDDSFLHLPSMSTASSLEQSMFILLESTLGTEGAKIVIEKFGLNNNP